LVGRVLCPRQNLVECDVMRTWYDEVLLTSSVGRVALGRGFVIPVASVRNNGN